MAVAECKEKNRASKQFNQLSEVAEGIPALAWVTLEQKPGPFAADMKESAQFYANRIIKDHRERWARVQYTWLIEDYDTIFWTAVTRNRSNGRAVS